MQSGRECGQFKKLKWVLQPRKQGHPSKRWGHTSVVHDGSLLIFGGNHNGVTREGVQRVHCESLEGDTLDFAVQPEMRESHSCTLYHDCLYIYGGCISQEVPFFQLYPQQLTSDLLQVKLSGPTLSWRKLQQKNPIPPRESHVTALLQKRFLLVYGGTTPDQTFLDQFWLLDLETVSWQQVKDVRGRLEARIGATITPIGSDIYSFGGEWGDGEESQYSNDISKLRLEGELKGESSPCLIISKIQVSGARPNPRTGHSCVDYKGRMLIIIGGEGVSSKRASILYNDIWAFDLRTHVWAELPIQNRNAFRPRANFTANIYKNTIYIFGGFVNINTFKCTDQLITLTLNETRQTHRQQIQNRTTQIVPQNPQQPLYCVQCRFEYLPQERPQIVAEQAIVNPNVLVASTQNIVHAARFIASPFQALALISDAVTKILPQTHKTLDIDLILKIGQAEDPMLAVLLNRAHLRLSVQGIRTTKDELQRLVLSYRCEGSDPGFDLKNGLFRLGRQIFFGQLFQDGMLHAYLLTSQGIHKSVLHLQTLVYELERQQHRPLFHFLDQHGIILGQMDTFEFRMYVGDLTRVEGAGLELHRGHDDLLCNIQQHPSFREFVKDYFLNQRPLTLSIGGEPVPLIPYESLLRNESIQREQEPTTRYFSKVHLVVNEQPDLINPPSSFIKIYALGRRVGLYNKFPFISGFMEISDLSVLNYPRTRCDSWDVRRALQEEIQALLQESRKRESEIPIVQLEKEVYQ